MDTSAKAIDMAMDSDFSERLLGRITYRIYPQHLERFAITKLGIESAQYSHLIHDAGADTWRQCFYVLRWWYRQEKRSLRDLCTLVGEADRLGFVQKGTHQDLVNGKILDQSYLTRCHTGPYPDFASLVAPWYTDIIWQNMLLFPWMDEEALLLSEVYTALEMETVLGPGKTAQLKDYKDVFKNVKSEGTRIVVKGDPGIGKTTFTHKIAFDWATGELDMFDVVLVLKMKYAACNQTIESIVKEQIASVRDSNTTEFLIGEYLRSGRDRVLLVFDGLDEINLKKYPEIQSVLTGQSYRKCCILATTRPHVTKQLSRYMTLVAHLKGFSRRKAEQFISHIIDNPSDRKRFFGQLDRRKMSRMQRVPLIVQALALLFVQDENNELPETLTITYDKLVFYLRSTCESSQGLSKEEITAAMEEVDELAFKGLIRDDRQLVFSRDEVKNENVFKLGLLSGEKTRRGFTQSTVLQFPHKSVQENCGANHIAKRLEANDRKPWEAIVKQFHEIFSTEPEDSNQQPRPTQVQSVEQREDEMTQTRILGKAVQKVYKALSDKPNRNAAIIDMLHSLLNIGVFDSELDVSSLWAEYSKYPLIAESLNQEEKEALYEFMGLELLIDTTSEWREQQKAWVQSLKHEADERLTNYFLALKMVVTWIQQDPDMAKQKLREMAASFTSQGNLPTQSVSQDFTQLWEYVAAYETLFRFILGKLSPDQGRKILLEIAVLAVQHSFDETNGGVLPFQLIQSLATELMKENGSNVSEFAASPVLMYLDGKRSLEYTQMNLTQSDHAALKISGTDVQNTEEFINNLTKQLNMSTNFRIVELENITLDQGPLRIGMGLVNALFRSPVVSLELRDLDGYLTSYMTKNLPLSTQRLSMSRTSPSMPYNFPPKVNLTSLYMENCSSTFEADFPKLKKLSIIKTFRWDDRDILAIHKAVKSGRMPRLENLFARFRPMTGFGQQLLEILVHPTLRNVELLGADLNVQDGRILLRSITEGRLDHIFTLDLQDNGELGPLNDELKAACEAHQIHLNISPVSSKASPFAVIASFLNQPSSSSDNNAVPPTLDLGAMVANLAPAFLSGQTRSLQPTKPVSAIGNLLSSVLPPTISQPSSAATSGSRRVAPTDFGNILSNVLQTAVGSQSARTRTSSSTNQSHPKPPVNFGSIVSSFFQAESEESESDDESGNQRKPDCYMEDDLD